jgi:hypothetical protein
MTRPIGVTVSWRKSRFSENGPNCVEVRNTLDEVRDSKNSGGPTLRGDVGGLTRAIKRGRLAR